MIELVKSVLSIIVAPAAGLLGTLLGAKLASRRETSNLKRDTYLRLLENLMELKRAGVELAELTKATPAPTLSEALGADEVRLANEKFREEAKRKSEEILARQEKAFALLNSAMATSLLMPGRPAMDALGELVGTASEIKDPARMLLAIDQAVLRLVKVARKDLNL